MERRRRWRRRVMGRNANVVVLGTRTERPARDAPARRQTAIRPTYVIATLALEPVTSPWRRHVVSVATSIAPPPLHPKHRYRRCRRSPLSPPPTPIQPLYQSVRPPTRLDREIVGFRNLFRSPVLHNWRFDFTWTSVKMTNGERDRTCTYIEFERENNSAPPRQAMRILQTDFSRQPKPCLLKVFTLHGIRAFRIVAVPRLWLHCVIAKWVLDYRPRNQGRREQ